MLSTHTHTHIDTKNISTGSEIEINANAIKNYFDKFDYSNVLVKTTFLNVHNSTSKILINL